MRALAAPSWCLILPLLYLCCCNDDLVIALLKTFLQCLHGQRPSSHRVTPGSTNDAMVTGNSIYFASMLLSAHGPLAGTDIIAFRAQGIFYHFSLAWAPPSISPRQPVGMCLDVSLHSPTDVVACHPRNAQGTNSTPWLRCQRTVASASACALEMLAG
jgi:hypothetical protein